MPTLSRFCCHLLVSKRVISSRRPFQSKSVMSDSRKKVFIARPDFAPIGVELLQNQSDVTIWKGSLPIPRADLLREISGKHAIFCSLTEKIDEELIKHAGEQLKCVATISVGYDHIDVAACKKHGIRVGYTPNVLTDATAELTVALLLATNRRLVEANKEVYNGGWKSWSPNWLCGPGLKGSRIFLFGFGRIGQEIAARLLAFKPCAITYTTRSERATEAAAVGANKVCLDEMLCESDVIIICCALTPETEGVFNAHAFRKMKKNAILINTARGAIVDQPALYDALKNKRIWAAGLDVTTPEPLPLNDPLLTLNNLVILPHIGSADINTRAEMSRITAANILGALNEGQMIYEVQ